MKLKAFTMIEMVIVMLVIGIMATTAIPKYIELRNEALVKGEDYSAGAIRLGITDTYAQNMTRNIKPLYPAALDNASICPASGANPLFINVIMPMTSQWEKMEESRYKGPTGREYVYDKDKGTFLLASAAPPPPPAPSFPINPAINLNNFPPYIRGLTTLTDSPIVSSESLAISESSFIPDESLPDLTSLGGVYGTNLHDQFTSIEQTADGGYIAVGNSTDYATHTSEMLVAKLRPDGSIEWVKGFKYPTSAKTYAGSVQQTADGGFIIGGRIELSPSSSAAKALAIKLDATGVRQWSNIYNANWYSEGPGVVKQASDGSMVMMMASSSRLSLLKLDQSTGAVIPTSVKTYAGITATGTVDSFQTTSDGGYIITANGGSWTDMNSNTAAVVKLDSGANLQWYRRYKADSITAISSVQETAGGFMMAGSTYSYSGSEYSGYVLKTDLNGNPIWGKAYDVAQGRAGDLSNQASTIKKTQDGNFVVGGYLNPTPAAYNGYLTKISSDGNLIWGKRYGATFSTYSSFNLTRDGGIVATGLSADVPAAGSAYNAVVVKTDAEGNVVR